MAVTPTYVVGVGGTGVDVVAALANQRTEGESDDIGLLAIDSDREALDSLSDVPSIYLTSDSGVVGETLAEYPFLANDDVAPAQGANRLRHVGRYKLDNSVAPTFRTQREAIVQRIERYFDDHRTSLTVSANVRTVVVVCSLAGGTGGGTLPLLAALIDDAIGRSDGAEFSTQLVGIGVVPPLDFDPEYELPPVDRVGYLNTFATLRDLQILQSADDNEVAVPVYSQVNKGDAEGADSYRTPGRVFRLRDPLFDSFWLASRNFPDSMSSAQSDRGDWIVDVVAGAIRSLAARTTESDSRWSRESAVAPLGAVGYASVTVQHERLREFCDRKQELEAVKSELEGYVESKISSLRDHHEELTAVLKRDIKEVYDCSLDTIYLHLPTDSEMDSEPLLDVKPNDLDTALETIAERQDKCSYYRSVLSLQHTLSSGRICSAVRSDARKTITEIRERYEFSLVAEHETASLSLPELAEEVESSLDERKTEFEELLEETDVGLRDLVPPTHDLFTSDREQIGDHIEVIERDLRELSTVQDHLDIINAHASIADRHVQQARNELQEAINDVERDISHFKDEKERLRGRVTELEREVAALHELLANPEERDHEYVLGLDWDAVTEVTIDDVEERLTSIDAYVKQGLVKEEAGGIIAGVRECYETSRDWPMSIVRRETPAVSGTTYDETTILFHEENERSVEMIRSSLTGPDCVLFSSDETLSYGTDPFEIEVASFSNRNIPESLIGFHWLQKMANAGVLTAMSERYRTPDQAFAYPEWYDTEPLGNLD